MYSSVASSAFVGLRSNSTLAYQEGNSGCSYNSLKRVTRTEAILPGSIARNGSNLRLPGWAGTESEEEDMMVRGKRLESTLVVATSNEVMDDQELGFIRRVRSQKLQRE